MAELKDTSLNYIVGDKWLYYSASEQRLVNKVKKQAEDFPDDVKILAENDDGSVHVRMPSKWFKPPSPPKKRDMTDEQRDELRERLAAARSKIPN